MSVRSSKVAKSPVAMIESTVSCGRVLDPRGNTTHYLVPAAEYEGLIDAGRVEPRVAPQGPSRAAIEQAAKLLESPTTIWHDAEEVMRGIVSNGLIAVREQSGLTQAQLGRLASMPQSQVSRLEKDLDGATMRVLKRIAAALSGAAPKAG